MVEEPAARTSSVGKEPTKRYKSVRRDPSEPTPTNWQRKPHVADNIPSPIESHIQLNATGTSVDFGSGDVCSLGEYIFLDFDRDTAPPISTDLRPAKSFDVVRIQRFLKDAESIKMEVNYTARPSAVLRRSADSRELYATFKKRVVPAANFRGKCTVQVRNSIRNLPKYREKPSQFYIAQFYDFVTHRVYDIVPVQSMKSLTHLKVAELKTVAEYALVKPEETAKLCENSRKKRGPVVTAESASSADNGNEDDASTAGEGLPQPWPFRYFDDTVYEFLNECELPSNSPETKIGEDHQAQIEKWTGHKLRYYTQTISKTTRQLEMQYADANSGDEMEPVDTELPYVQEMPSGYIARGTDATSIPSSIPAEGISEFVAKCRESCAKKLDVESCNVEFLDACCSAYSNNVGYESAALIEVMNLKKSHICIPELKEEECLTLRKMLNPFLKTGWHDIFKAIGTRTSAEIARYFWTRQLKRKRNVSFAQQIVSVNECAEILEHKGCISEYESNQLRCAVCLTNTAYGWEALPHYMSLLPLDIKEHTHKYAMCSRCARLWYRYGVGWRPATEVKELENHDEIIVDQDLLEDAKAYTIQEEKRTKRLENAMNKKQISKQTLAQQKKTKTEEDKSNAGDKKVNEMKTSEKKSTDAKKVDKKTSDDKSSDKKIKAKTETGKPATKTTAKSEKSINATGKEKNASKKKPAASASSSTPSAANSAKTKAKAGDKKGSSAANSKEDDNSNDAGDSDNAELNSDTDKPETAAKRTSSEKETPAKRAKTAHPLSDEGIDALLDTIDEVPDLDTPVQPYTCAVCGQLDPSMVSKTCAGCGISVHVACYGQGIAMKYKDNNLEQYTFPRDLNPPDSEAESANKDEATDTDTDENDFSGVKWLCDCCANSRLLLNADPFYQCRFCPLFPMAYNEWMAGNTTQYPVDGLKKAIDGTWCHVRCALYIPGVTFQNAREYEDIDDTDLNKDLHSGICAICYEQYGGRNEHANDKEKERNATSTETVSNALAASSHDTSVLNSETNTDGAASAPVDAASKENERQEIVKFSSSCYFSFPRPEEQQKCWNKGVKIQCNMCSDKFHVSCASQKHFKMGFTKETIPKPIIVCSKHTTCNIPLTPISYMDLNLNLTAMQLYVRTHKVSKQRPVYSAQELNNLLNERKAESTLLDEPLIVPFTSQVDSTRTIFCSSCLRRDRTCYISVDKGVLMCTLCYTNHTWQPQEQNKQRELELNGLAVSVLNKMYREVCRGGVKEFVNYVEPN